MLKKWYFFKNLVQDCLRKSKITMICLSDVNYEYLQLIMSVQSAPLRASLRVFP